MLRLYNSQRLRRVEIGGRVRQIGTVPVGTIVLIQGRKLQVEAWLPGDYSAWERSRFVTKRIAGGHIAQVRELATFLVDAASIRTDEPDGRALLRCAALRAIAAVTQDDRELADVR